MANMKPGSASTPPYTPAAVPTTRQFLTSNGLTGGGDLSADRTVTPVYGTTAGTVCQGNDSRLGGGPHTHPESDVTSLVTDLATKAPTARLITAGTGLAGGGDLSADRTLAVSYGTAAGTAAQGNDSRITGAVQSTGGTMTGDLIAPHFKTSTGFFLPFIAPRHRIPSYRQASTTQNFQSGHGWVAGGAGLSTSNANDTSTFIRGTQCATIVTAANASQSRWRVTGLTPFDLTGKAIRLTFKVDDVTHLNLMQFYVGTSSLANFFSWKVHTHSASATNMVQSGEWVTVVLQWADVNAVSGTNTFTNKPNTTTGFTDMQFTVQDDGAGAVTYHLQSVEFINDTTDSFPNGVISITFDDSWQSVYDYARPKMDGYGYRGTLYTIADQIGLSTKFTLAELKTIQVNSGWDVAGHAYSLVNHNQTNGFASLTAAQVNDEFRNLKMWMVNNGFLGDTFAYPKGHFDVTTDNVPVDQIAAQYWSASRTIVSEANEHYRPGMLHRIRALSGVNDGSALGGVTVTALTAANGPIDICRNSGAWLILCFHEITTTTPTASTQCSQTGFNTTIDAINAAGVPVLPISEVLQYFS